MAFESLTEKLSETFRKLKSKGKLIDSDIDPALREIKLAFLEADVNLKVTKQFIDEISVEAKGEKVFESLSPGQTVVKIVNDKLTALLGETQADLKLDGNLSTILMIGLQGSGKTTTSAKLANLLRKKGKKPLLVACDVYRPAAIEQLKTLGKQIDIPVFAIDNEKNVIKIVKSALEFAKENGNTVVILDTAGRLNIDDEMMAELRGIKAAVDIDETLLVIDSMIGQESVNIAKSFDEQLDISGVILTKFDSDSRGGAALSVKSVVGKPIKFIGSGEKISDLEEFYPDRVA
ncbi:MAG: signal recognition particle receptor subunit alpha, partial [Oscillospiraceae bacterium]|nr:signal recognition particle receptor subunit alpha [Oscillospiraceae bacterium]